MYNRRSDWYAVISSGRNKGSTPLSCRKKNGVSTTYANRDPKQRISEIETPKIASSNNASDLTLGFKDALSDYLGRLEEFNSLAPSHS